MKMNRITRALTSAWLLTLFCGLALLQTELNDIEAHGLTDCMLLSALQIVAFALTATPAFFLFLINCKR